jgi:hypothetical protein
VAQTHQSPQTPKAIDDPEPTRFLGHGDDHDRHLLTTGRQGSQQSLLGFLATQAQTLVAKVQLVGFESEMGRFHRPISLRHRGSGLARPFRLSPAKSRRINGLSAPLVFRDTQQ